MPIIIGTSGWSYDDWAGAFYPPSLKKSEWLDYYASRFRAVEINSTFYSFPPPFMVKSWAEKARKHEGFEYSVKLPGKVTHESLLSDTRTVQEFEEKVILPLHEAGVLGCALIQASPYFRLSDKGQDTGHFNALKDFLGNVSTSKYRYAIELRHSSWITDGKLDPETARLLKAHDVAQVIIDGPSMPRVLDETATHSYVRLHGRNYDVWYRKDEGLEGRLNRYDYLYTEDELRPWKDRLESMRAKDIRVFFNNHPRAGAVKNAWMLEKLLGQKTEDDSIKVCRQSSMSSFFGCD